jgi:hypothetical protein
MEIIRRELSRDQCGDVDRATNQSSDVKPARAADCDVTPPEEY